MDEENKDTIGKQDAVGKHSDHHEENIHHKYDIPQMDTNGWGNHPDLHYRAEKRFEKTAQMYCHHHVSGDHDECIANDIECPFELALFDAYRLYMST